MGGRQAQPGLELGQGGPGADPELAGAGVGVELLGVPAGQRAEVQRRAVVAAVVALAFLGGLQDQHGVGLVVQAQAGQVREAGVRAEAVVAVVGADLQRTGGDDQAFAFELLGDGPAPGGGVAGDGVAFGQLLRGTGAQLLAMNALKASELGRCERLLTRSSRGWEAETWVFSASFTVPSSHQLRGLGQQAARHPAASPRIY